ncbi:MAG: glutamate formimidoyltransferase [Planctomycetota bacterium]|nr:glutamate formimidoyltransferase [Planctomycetota bacterium]
MKLVECVPNFSEGKRAEVVEKIVSAIKSVPEVRVLDKEMDSSHNRSVITFVGPPDQVGRSAFKATERASQLIDLTQHKGEHPRIGATDVIPFIPLKGVTMDECISLSRAVGREIGEKLQIPVYLYEYAATRPDRKNLADIRRGEFEGLKEQIGKDPERVPDFGPNRIHPTAGATVVGARTLLIAYNVNLDTDYLDVAKKIARKIRESSGGLQGVKALGILINKYNRQIAQVTMNLTNYKVTSIKRVFDAIKEEALYYGVRVLESELIGLAPADVFSAGGGSASGGEDTTPEELQLTGFSPRMIIENLLPN